MADAVSKTNLRVMQGKRKQEISADIVSALPDELAIQKNFLECRETGPCHKSSNNFAGSYASLNYDNSFNLTRFRSDIQLKILEATENRVILDLVNVDVSIANALRRILIADIPTVAIETVNIYQNTGVIQDEVLAHRIGLIPFKINPDQIGWRNGKEELTDSNSVKFKFHVKCSQQDVIGQKSYPVYAKQMHWEPLSAKQAELYKDSPPSVVQPDILITKLRPGQEIELEVFCEKGIGKTHAKWSAVATAVYRLMPHIKFPQGDLKGQEAQELKNLCPMHVFDIEEDKAYVRDSRCCTTCRACIERFPNQVQLLKNKNHFIFTIESSGAIPAPKLLTKAIEILRQKILAAQQSLHIALSQNIC